MRDGVQYVITLLKPNQYEEIEVLTGIPVKWTIVAEESSLNGCNDEVYIPEYDMDVKLKPGENVIEFLPEESGIFPYSCWMGMIRSNIVVTEREGN